MTVRETIMLAAKLRYRSKGLSSDETDAVREKLVKKLVSNLGLNFCLDRQIKSISGGERKRVEIAVELIGEPPILFLDEPTSGLDSFTALVLIQLLKKIANELKTIVIMSIHQPRFEIVKIIDQIYLLSKGQPIYNGDIEGCIKHFTDLGYPIPQNVNPSDHFIGIKYLYRNDYFGHEKP